MTTVVSSNTIFTNPIVDYTIMLAEERYGVVYKLENLVNGKLYIGLTTHKNPLKCITQIREQ